jgi:hypothetical protein
MAAAEIAVGQRAAVNVGDRLVDDLPRHRDAGVAAAAEPLHLRDRGGALVEVVAVLGAHVAPAAVLRLGPARELDGPGEHGDELLAASLVLLLAEQL